MKESPVVRATVLAHFEFVAARGSNGALARREGERCRTRQGEADDVDNVAKAPLPTAKSAAMWLTADGEETRNPAAREEEGRGDLVNEMRESRGSKCSYL